MATPEHPTRSDEEVRIPSSKTIYNRDAERDKLPGFSQQLNFQKGLQKPIAPAISSILPAGQLNTGVGKTLLESSSLTGNTLAIQAVNTNVVTTITPPAAHTNVNLVSPGTTIAHNLSVPMASIIRQPTIATPPAAHQGATYVPHTQNRLPLSGNASQKTLRQQTAIVPTVTKLPGQSVTIATGNALHGGGTTASTSTNNSLGTTNVHISIQQPTNLKTSSIQRFPATVTTINAPSMVNKKLSVSSHHIIKKGVISTNPVGTSITITPPHHSQMSNPNQSTISTINKNVKGFSAIQVGVAQNNPTAITTNASQSKAIAKITPNRHSNNEHPANLQAGLTQIRLSGDSKIDGHPITYSTSFQNVVTLPNARNFVTTNQQLTHHSNTLQSSPKPSILTRKRPAHDSPSMQSAKKNLLSSNLSTTHSEANNNLESRIVSCSPKMQTASAAYLDPYRENSQSSTDTATSNESTPSQMDLQRLKREADDGNNSPTSELSPRKRSRKQIFNRGDIPDQLSTDEEYDTVNVIKFNLRIELEKINAQRLEQHRLHLERRKEENSPEDMELKANLIEIDAVLANACVDDKVTETFVKQVRASLEKECEFVDKDGYRWTSGKERSTVNLMNFCQYESKGRTNHFMRRSDVKPKDERRPTVNELASAKTTNVRATGWRFYHIASQFEDMSDCENDLIPRLALLDKKLLTMHNTERSSEEDTAVLADIVKGNMQRIRLIVDQMKDTKSALLKIRDQHHNKVRELIDKNHSKRPVKKKDR